MTLVVNLFGGPGSGKSTTRAGVFHYLKLDGYNVEEVPEYAKVLTWERRFMALSCQPHVFGEQLWAMQRLEGQVEAIITDSPLLLGNIYASPEESPALLQLVEDKFYEFQNLNYFIVRSKDYNPIGRNQTLDEARDIDGRIYNYLQRNSIYFTTVSGTKEAAEYIYKEVKGLLDGS